MTKRALEGKYNIQSKMYDMHGEICNMFGKVPCGFKYFK
jgi:hypothetical protein